ncbi:GNAT family N-acetyltransferase [Cedecea neteri]|uniref:GNAT family N-acetyltransferase n=1 Tax=Cedecea neteri TaxID=158822 RepID=UPI002AA84CB0|nr:GNAT family N-acetyltransferase [Cedecea neteri]WPU21949.1 GNAT family N-acetyltransferase [Cedecea neteri]
MKYDKENLVFEGLTTEHLPYFYAIRFSVTENLVHSHQIQYLLREKAMADINQGYGYICRYQNNYVAVGMGVFIPDALLAALFVIPEMQNKGIGTDLLQRITDKMFSQGVKEIALTTDHGSHAEQFYFKNGWSRSGNDEFNQLVMKKKQHI